MDDPLVSIITITYNHESFIEKTIQGVISQIVDFRIEYIIAEDCSTDNTRSICQQYANKHHDLIRLITSETNLGAVENELRAMNEAKSKYIAICEGDDYWTDPYKLQKQIDFLENNLEYSVCFHRCKHHDFESDTWWDDACGDYFVNSENKGIEISIQMFLDKWITQPLTMVYRRDLFNPDVALQYKYYRDNHLIYNLLQNGKGYLFSFYGGVYNYHNAGIHSKMDAVLSNGLTVNIAKDLYSKNKKDKLLKSNLLRSLQYYIHYSSLNKKYDRQLWVYTMEHFFYSLSFKQLLKNTLSVFNSIK